MHLIQQHKGKTRGVNVPLRPDLFTKNVKAVTTIQTAAIHRKTRGLQNNLSLYTFHNKIQGEIQKDLYHLENKSIKMMKRHSVSLGPVTCVRCLLHNAG